jgi:hypothetical protein
MLYNQIMHGLAHQRGLVTRRKPTEGASPTPLDALKKRANGNPFGLIDAIHTDKPVYLWHTVNGIDYIAYQLLPSDTWGSHVAFGVRELHGPKSEIHNISEFYFVEYDGMIASAPQVWPMSGVYWLGDGLVERYHVRLEVLPTKVPECKG